MEEKKELPRNIDFQTIKLTNPLYLGYLAEGIQRLATAINIPTIQYESLYAYFLNTVQYGGDIAEFWISYEPNENKIFSYANWFVRGYPHRGVVTCDFIHACRNRKDATTALVKEFYDFGVRHRCPLYEGMATNEKTYRVFRQIATQKGFELLKVDTINFLAKRRK